MAYAIVKGAIESDFIHADKIIVSDCNADSLEKFREYGCAATTDNRKAAENCQYLLFAVKPQSFPAVSAEIVAETAAGTVVATVADVVAASVATTISSK